MKGLSIVLLTAFVSTLSGCGSHAKPTIGQSCYDAGSNEQVIWRGSGSNPFNICANMYKETYPAGGGEDVWAVEIPHQEFERGNEKTTIALFFDKKDAIDYVNSYPYVKREKLK